MPFCFIAMNWIQDFLKKIPSGKFIKMGVHYVYPIKDLVGTGHVSHLFVVHGLIIIMIDTNCYEVIMPLKL